MWWTLTNEVKTKIIESKAYIYIPDLVPDFLNSRLHFYTLDFIFINSEKSTPEPRNRHKDMAISDNSDLWWTL